MSKEVNDGVKGINDIEKPMLADAAVKCKKKSKYDIKKSWK